jgi:putative membrane protein
MTLFAGLVRRWAVIVLAAAAVLVTGAGPVRAATTLNDADRIFLRAAHQSNLAEIATGKLAQSKGSSQAVKDLGAMLVTDHTKLDAALRKIATAKNVSLPSAPNADQQALQAKLTKASAGDFDALFVAGQVGAHAKAMQLGETELARGSDAAVKKTAADAAPVIAAHHHKFIAQARAMGLPDSVDAGLSGTAALSSPDDRRAAGLTAIGGLFVAAGAVLAVKKRRYTTAS